MLTCGPPYIIWFLYRKRLRVCTSPFSQIKLNSTNACKFTTHCKRIEIPKPNNSNPLQQPVFLQTRPRLPLTTRSVRLRVGYSSSFPPPRCFPTQIAISLFNHKWDRMIFSYSNIKNIFESKPPDFTQRLFIKRKPRSLTVNKIIQTNFAQREEMRDYYITLKPERAF